MKKDLKYRIEQLVRTQKLKKRDVDVPRIKSILKSAIDNVKVVKKIPITDESATLVFREFYESIRQIGDAKWWSLGYEPRVSHEVSMEILQNMQIRESVKLHKLDWFRKIRNNANYRGYKVKREQAKEIADFWKSCSRELIQQIQNSIKRK
ncbi:MAG: hypothetical protein KAW40_03090 [Candidatus Aenigmarchaeota archaeon]|nr:hypothetical protein [Candidatus Aenigmarchaeota archaeon]